MTIPKVPFIALLILLNAVPVYGVFAWDWQSFDLIFLYWLENLIIGLFTVFRFLVRPYSHPVELVFPLFLTPFFIFHYGMFCYVHGAFVIGLFGEEALGELASQRMTEIILPIIENRHLFWPVAALFSYQVLDWVRDTSERGLGSDGLKELMVAPYRRIIVLHITIIVSGFALAAMDEPLAGLLILIVLKTAFDLYHWNKDEQNARVQSSPEVNEAMKRKVDALLDQPSIKINGKEIHFDSYEDLKDSKYYGMMQAVLRMIGGNQQLKTMEAYIEQRMNERCANQ